MTPAQLRAGCALLNITATQLASMAHVAPITAQQTLRGKAVHANTIAKLRSALEAQGVAFTERGVEFASCE